MTRAPAPGQPRSDEVYARLRAAIIRGEIRPNERLVETDIADQLQASRTPVREALQRLSGEGLVSTRRRGWIAREHTADEIRDIYEVRTALEGYASHLTALCATDEQLEGIASLHRAGKDESIQSPFQLLVNVNEVFHDAVIVACGNPRLVDLARSNRQYYFNYRIAMLYSNEEAEAALAGHGRIVHALRERDAAAAEQHTRDHIAEGLKVILTKLR